MMKIAISFLLLTFTLWADDLNTREGDHFSGFTGQMESFEVQRHNLRGARVWNDLDLVAPKLLEAEEPSCSKKEGDCGGKVACEGKSGSEMKACEMKTYCGMKSTCEMKSDCGTKTDCGMKSACEMKSDCGTKTDCSMKSACEMKSDCGTKSDCGSKASTCCCGGDEKGACETKAAETCGTGSCDGEKGMAKRMASIGAGFKKFMGSILPEKKETAAEEKPEVSAVEPAPEVAVPTPEEEAPEAPAEEVVEEKKKGSGAFEKFHNTIRRFIVE